MIRDVERGGSRIGNSPDSHIHFRMFIFMVCSHSNISIFVSKFSSMRLYLGMKCKILRPVCVYVCMFVCTIDRSNIYLTGSYNGIILSYLLFVNAYSIFVLFFLIFSEVFSFSFRGGKYTCGNV